ncbi:MAG: hypothetical protein ACI909_003369 [Planctomycetota bacterium]|jgi:hypothetical protein
MERTSEHSLYASATFDNGVLRCSGIWTVFYLSDVESSLSTLHWPASKSILIDMANVTALDTDGALLLHRSVEQLKQANYQVNL